MVSDVDGEEVLVLDPERDEATQDIRDVLTEMEVDFDFDEEFGSFSFVEALEGCPVFAEVVALRFDPVTEDLVDSIEPTDEQFARSEIWFCAQLETWPMVQLGAIGALVSQFPEWVGTAGVSREDHDETAGFVKFILERPWTPDWVGELVDLVYAIDDLVVEAIETGTEWSLDEGVSTPGFAEMAQATIHDRNRRSREARDLTYEALYIFEAAQIADWEVAALWMIAITEGALSNAEAAIAAVDRAEATASANEVDVGNDLQAQVRYHVLVSLDRLDEAQELAGRSGLDLDDEDAVTSEPFAMAQLADGNAAPITALRARAGRRDSGATLAERARHAFNAGQVLVASGQLDKGIEQLERANSLFEAVGEVDGLADAQLMLAFALVSSHRDHERSVVLYEQAAREVNRTSEQSMMLLGSVGALLGVALDEIGVHPEDLSLASQGQIKMAKAWRYAQDFEFDKAAAIHTELAESRALPGAQFEAMNESNLALALIGQTVTHGDGSYSGQQLEPIRTHALKAIEAFEPLRWSERSAEERSKWIDLYGQSYLTAMYSLTLGESPDKSAVVELLELVRSQLMPGLAELETDRNDHNNGRPVVVMRSSSPIADLVLKRRSGDLILLSSLVEAQVGHAGWYWSQWNLGPHLISATVSPSGRIDLSEAAPGDRMLPTARPSAHSFHLQEPVEATRRFAAHHRGLLTDDGLDASEEFELARTVGEAIIPKELREALNAASQSNPLPLLLAADWHEPAFPVGMLRVGPGPERLFEVAVLQHAVPPRAATFERVAPPTGLITEIIDPAGDLPLVRSLSQDWVPDQSGLARFWQAAQRHESLLFVGHGVPDTDSRQALKVGPAPSHLVRADDLLSRRVGAPSQAVLAGCTTAGIDDPERVQEWGLVEALIASGTREVVASQRDIVADGTILGVVTALRSALATAQPLKMALREIQLDYLDRVRHESGGVPSGQQWVPWVAYGVDKAVSIDYRESIDKQESNSYSAVTDLGDTHG